MGEIPAAEIPLKTVPQITSTHKISELHKERGGTRLNRGQHCSLQPLLPAKMTPSLEIQLYLKN